MNSEDGSVAYDVSFALVWVEDDTALNRNEAFAAASCRGCTTVAVAFQVVLLVGSVDVVVPQNLSTAANYACVECVTYALATQLVVTVPGPLDEADTAELAAIWAELQAFGEQIEGVPLAELKDRLTEFEARILGVVRPEGTDPAVAPTSSSETSGAGSSGTAARTTAAPAATGASTTDPATEATTTSAPTSAEPTTEAPTTASSTAAGTAESSPVG